MAATRGPKPARIELTDDERAQLESWARRRRSAAGLAARSKIVLAAAEGLSNTEIAARLGVSRPTVTTWRSRFAEHRFDRPLAGFQLTQAKLADMALELQKAMLLALHLGRLKDAHGVTPTQVSIGKLNHVRESIDIARQCRTILAANGITGEYPVLRHANNLESVLTYEGTSEVHQLTVGQALTGIAAFR